MVLKLLMQFWNFLIQLVLLKSVHSMKLQMERVGSPVMTRGKNLVDWLCGVVIVVMAIAINASIWENRLQQLIFDRLT